MNLVLVHKTFWRQGSVLSDFGSVLMIKISLLFQLAGLTTVLWSRVDKLPEEQSKQ